jgi:hypothetical protein
MTCVFLWYICTCYFKIIHKSLKKFRRTKTENFLFFLSSSRRINQSKIIEPLLNEIPLKHPLMLFQSYVFIPHKVKVRELKIHIFFLSSSGITLSKIIRPQAKFELDLHILLTYPTLCIHPNKSLMAKTENVHKRDNCKKSLDQNQIQIWFPHSLDVSTYTFKYPNKS